MMPITLADLPAAFIARNRDALAGKRPDVKPYPAGLLAPAHPLPVKRRIRQKQGDVLNALEARFLAKLRTDYADKAVLSQAVRLELARGIWYKPDFFIPDAMLHLGTGKTLAIAYEVKGPHAFRGGFENLKVAARVHPWVKFFLVWEDNGRVWQRQEVLP